MNNPEKQGLKGFTLLEVLIAIVIFSIVVTTLFSSFRSFVISGEYVKESLDQNLVISSLFKRVNTDLEATYMIRQPRYKKPEFDSDPDPFRLVGFEENVEGQLTASTIRFVSLAHARLHPDDAKGLARIVYYLRPNPNQGYDLCRSDNLIPVAQDTRSCLDPVLCENVTGFEIVYFDVNGDEYKYWDSDDKTFQYTFPSRIDLIITLKFQETEHTFQTAISLIPTRRALE